MIILVDNILRFIKSDHRDSKAELISGEINTYETTGIYIKPGSEPKIIANNYDIIFVDYEDLSHKLWRAQEFTLIARNKNIFRPPILDLGCGDGSFASVLFDKIDYGVDPDAQAVEVAKSLNIYNEILNTYADHIQLDDESVNAVFSNSVLEHTTNLEAIINEMSRIISPDGIFMLTVPNNNFTTIMSNLFGINEATRLNESVFYHRNLLQNDEWVKLLNKYNFQVLKLQNYQPEKINYIFRLLRSPIIRRINKIKNIWNDSYLIDLVYQSLECQEGAGTFIIAKK